MGENRCQKHHLRNAAVCGGAGGGHIIRSTGRKDRHSKVCTAKGPRDRRVRLSAHTAIQFYDVQDRLGYDRPSKAVDWLINKAKTAIDELAKLPAWKPAVQNPNCQREIRDGNANFVGSVAGPSCKRTMVTLEENDNQNDVVFSSFLPPSMDSDTIKTFLPVEANSYQDLKLSLQSFQDPIILLHHHPSHDIFSGTGAVTVDGDATHLGFDASEHHEHHQRLLAWNVGIDAAAGCGGGEREGYLFNSPLPPFPPPLFGGERQFLSSQRGPLQSSNTPWIRAWTEQSPATAISAGDPSQHHQTTMLPIFPSPFSGIGFPAGVDGFSGFRIPARIQGEEEEHDGISDKLSSVSSDSCH